MRMFDDISSLRAYVRGMRAEGKRIGFVPTMGALHEGHLSLIKKAKADCEISIASIFVNPTQFGPNEDYERYPRTLSKDQNLTSTVGLDAMFLPDVQEMYPGGYQTSVRVHEVTRRLEGEVRPGHFDGVATVVLKLMNIVMPDRCYFGQKDYQQAAMIQRMVRDLNAACEVVVLPTIRDTDGLALSSRNAYLTPDQRAAAPVLYRALTLAKQLADAGETSAAAIQSAMCQLLAQEPLAEPEYVDVAHAETLNPLETIENTPAVALLAVKVGTTRLIDNILLGNTKPFATR